MKNVRCAVIGIGTMGKKYAKMIDDGEIEGLTLAAVCCRSAVNCEWARQNLSPDVKICVGEDNLYKNDGLFDAVIIVTPHKSHPSMAIRALKAGKHVLCDKPAGATAADAQAINEAASRADGIYAMMCHQRTYPKYLKIKELIESNAIGRIRRINLVNSGFFRTKFYHLSSSWRSSWAGEGGGALINQGYHLIDMWLYLFGMPQSVYADIPFGKYNNFDVDDEATLIMDYPDKLTGTFIISTGEGCPSERLEISGSIGKIVLDCNRLTVTRSDRDAEKYAETAQVTSGQELKLSATEFTFDEPDEAYQTMLKNFACAILKGDRLIAPGNESFAALSIINSAYLSAWKGEKITLPADMREYIEFLHKKEGEENNRR